MTAEDRIVALRVALDLLVAALREGDEPTIKRRLDEASDTLKATRPTQSQPLPG